MVSTCNKCGATNDGNFAGWDPCHLRDPKENHDFPSADQSGKNSGTFI